MTWDPIAAVAAVNPALATEMERGLQRREWGPPWLDRIRGMWAEFVAADNAGDTLSAGKNMRLAASVGELLTEIDRLNQREES